MYLIMYILLFRKGVLPLRPFTPVCSFCLAAAPRHGEVERTSSLLPQCQGNARSRRCSKDTKILHTHTNNKHRLHMIKIEESRARHSSTHKQMSEFISTVFDMYSVCTQVCVCICGCMFLNIKILTWAAENI